MFSCEADAHSAQRAKLFWPMWPVAESGTHTVINHAHAHNQRGHTRIRMYR